MVGLLTGPQRVVSVMEAVLAQIMLKADLFHTFMDILRRENSDLADVVQQDYCKSYIWPLKSISWVTVCMKRIPEFV